MLNSEWTLKNLEKYPIMLVLLSMFIGALIYEERDKASLRAELKQEYEQRILCEQRSAATISQLKDDKVNIMLFYQARQDTLSLMAQVNKSNIRQIKRKIK